MKRTRIIAIVLATALLVCCVPNKSIVTGEATVPPLATVGPLLTIAPEALPTQDPATPEPLPTPTPVPTPTPTPIAPYEDRDLLTIIDHPQLASLPLPDAQQMMRTVEWLSAAPRTLGTDHEKQCAQTICDTLTTMGYDVRQLPFDQTLFQRPAWRSELTIGAGGEALQLQHNPGTPNISTTAAMLYWDDQQSVISDLAGLIVVVPTSATAAILYGAADSGKKPAALITLEPYDQALPFEGVTVLHAPEKVAPAVKSAAQQGAYATLVVEGALNTYASMNIEARNPAAAPGSDVYIVCAHYDSFRDAPGAVDNGSGVAALLESARLYLKTKPTSDVRFVLFSAEEDGLVGSQHYVSSLSGGELSAIKGVLNLDMFGSPLTPMQIGSSGGKSNAMTNAFLRSYEAYKTEGNATFNVSEYLPALRRIENYTNSDHNSFSAAGIPAMLICQPPDDTFYHNANDTLDKIAPENLVRASLWVLTFILNLSIQE